MNAITATTTTTASRTFHGSRKYDPGCSITPMSIIYTNKTRSIWKMLGPFATASRRRTPPLYIAIHQVSLLSHAATVARRLRIDVHDDNDNNDNAWQRGPLWPHRMGPISVYCMYAHLENNNEVSLVVGWFYETHKFLQSCADNPVNYRKPHWRSHRRCNLTAFSRGRVVDNNFKIRLDSFMVNQNAWFLGQRQFRSEFTVRTVDTQTNKHIHTRDQMHAWTTVNVSKFLCCRKSVTLKRAAVAWKNIMSNDRQHWSMTMTLTFKSDLDRSR